MDRIIRSKITESELGRKSDGFSRANSDILEILRNVSIVRLCYNFGEDLLLKICFIYLFIFCYFYSATKIKDISKSLRDFTLYYS